MKCEICGQEFAESDEPELILHMKREHPITGDADESSDAKAPAEIDRDSLEPARPRDR